MARLKAKLSAPGHLTVNFFPAPGHLTVNFFPAPGHLTVNFFPAPGHLTVNFFPAPGHLCTKILLTPGMPGGMVRVRIERDIMSSHLSNNCSTLGVLRYIQDRGAKAGVQKHQHKRKEIIFAHEVGILNLKSMEKCLN